MQKRNHRGENIDSNFCDPTQCECGAGELLLERDGSEFCDTRASNHLDRGEQYDWILTLAQMWDDPVNDFKIKLPQ